MALYIGIMSGTSADGVDASLIDVQNINQVKAIEHYYLAFSDTLKRQITQLYQPQYNDLEAASQLAITMSQHYAEAIAKLLQKSNYAASQIAAIGCHGQTLRHRPEAGFSIQIMDGARLAYLSGIDLVCDFRSADIAAGGQGAPLVPAFQHAILRDMDKAQVFLNLGGIANISCFSQQGELLSGFDTGPANALLDEWCQLHSQQPYDKNGQWAAQGQTINALLETWLDEPYFKRLPPKSTGREYFNLAWLNRLSSNLNDYAAVDIQRTLLDLTAVTVAQAIKSQLNSAHVWLCGGGVHNQLLQQELAKQLGESFLLASSADIGLAPDWLESQCFAWLAYCYQNRVALNLPAVSGAKSARIAGCLYAK